MALIPPNQATTENSELLERIGRAQIFSMNLTYCSHNPEKRPFLSQGTKLKTLKLVYVRTVYMYTRTASHLHLHDGPV
jgi:hypothetical protein